MRAKQITKALNKFFARLQARNLVENLVMKVRIYQNGKNFPVSLKQLIFDLSKRVFGAECNRTWDQLSDYHQLGFQVSSIQCAPECQN
jgi:hypothetical protein